MRICISLFILFFFVQLNISKGQDTIHLTNPSFEDAPRKGGALSMPIKGWVDCGLSKFPGESPPDIHPVPINAWEVTKSAYDGETYLGLVTRYNNTYESLSQAMEKSVLAGKCYQVSVHLALSENYKSGTARSGTVTSWKKNQRTIIPNLENFSNHVRFLIAGGNAFCEWEEVLLETIPVSNTEWTEFTIVFTPQKDYKYITIGAFYKEGFLEAYNGHVLVDNLSPIIEVDCK